MADMTWNDVSVKPEVKAEDVSVKPEVKTEDTVQKPKFKQIIIRRRPRTNFTKEQKAYFEKVFLDTHYPDSYTKQDLAELFKIDESRIQVWFKNRRAKEKYERSLEENRNKNPAPSQANVNSRPVQFNSQHITPDFPTDEPNTMLQFQEPLPIRPPSYQMMSQNGLQNPYVPNGIQYSGAPQQPCPGCPDEPESAPCPLGPACTYGNTYDQSPMVYQQAPRFYYPPVQNQMMPMTPMYQPVYAPSFSPWVRPQGALAFPAVPPPHPAWAQQYHMEQQQYGQHQQNFQNFGKTEDERD